MDNNNELVQRKQTDLTTIPPRSSLCYTKKYSKDRLNSLRLLGDPTADDIARILDEDYGGLKNIHDLLSTVRKNAKLSDAEGGNIFRKFLKTTSILPKWVDPEKIKRGQRVHAVHTPFMGLSLFSGSLVGGGQFRTAAVVTALAGNITTDPTRRITETGMLLASLAFPGSLLHPGSQAHDSLTRIRLLHSALRHWLPKSGRLKAHKKLVPRQVYVDGEIPINQHDLAITLGVFCYINLRSLRRMGISLSQEDIQSYVHMWRYAGHVLGIQEDLLPLNLEDQEEFMLASMLHQGHPETIPEIPTKKFVDAFAIETNNKTYGLLPFSMVQTYLYQMIRYLNGDDYITGMNIENLGDGHWSVRLTRSLGFLFGTLLPKIPFGESLLFWIHTRNIRKQLQLRGTPVGHAAGSGSDIRSKL